MVLLCSQTDQAMPPYMMHGLDAVNPPKPTLSPEEMCASAPRSPVADIPGTLNGQSKFIH